MDVNSRITTGVFSAFFLAVIVLGFNSCKKEDDITKLYLSGTIQITSYPLYAEIGSESTVHLSGISHPDGKGLGLYIRYPWKSKADTIYHPSLNPMPVPMDVTVPLVYPDSLGSFTVNVSVFPIDADKYYSSSSSFYTTTVDQNHSIPEIKVNKDSQKRLVDDRDQMIYNFVRIGDNDWVSRNICSPFGNDDDLSRIGCPYYRSEAINRVFGRFYTWEEAVKACPEGWHLPSCEECESLPSDVGELMVDAHFNGDKMWAFWPDVKITGKSGLDLIPVGYCNASVNEQFDGILEYACFWTSDRNPYNPSQAIYKYIYLKENELKTGFANTNSLAMPVRCVADK